jgi:hypothetical protein
MFIPNVSCQSVDGCPVIILAAVMPGEQYQLRGLEEYPLIVIQQFPRLISS